MGQDSGDNGDNGALVDEQPGQPDRKPQDSESRRDSPDLGKPATASRLLTGRYRLGAVVGRGGMGTVWRARDEILGRTVAVKELRLPPGIDEGERLRLATRALREAKAMSTIRSRGVVTVFDVVDEGSRPWIVMELIEGRSLADIIRDDGPMSPEQAARTGLAVLEVLRSAHRAGILHRDVKPSNVIVADEDGRVVLTDFGIAKVEGDSSITSTGMLVGAPSYISPERARGDDLGPAADLWSLGALLYCAVEGRPPFDEGGAIATLTAVMNDPIEPPLNAGPLVEVITGLLAKRPVDRLDETRARELLTDALETAAGRDAGPSDAVPADTAEPPPVAGDADRGATPRQPIRLATTTVVRVEGDTAGPDPGGASSGGAVGGGAASGGAVGGDREGSVLAETDAVHPGPNGPDSVTGAVGVARRRWRALVIAVAAVLLAFLGTYLAMNLTGDGTGAETAGGQQGGDDEGSEDDVGTAGTDGGGTNGETTAGGSDDIEDPPDETTDPTDGSGEHPGTEPAQDPKEPVAPELPQGFVEVVDTDFHFRIALPEGWERLRIAGENSGGVYGDPAGDFPTVQVDFTSSPGNDAAAAWRVLEPATREASDNYRRISIKEVEWRGYPTVADWRFTRTVRGQRVRVLDRGFKVDENRGYAIMITCVAEEWDGKECRTLRDTAFGTFQPLE